VSTKTINSLMKNTPAKIDVILDEHIRISLLSMIEKTNKKHRHNSKYDDFYSIERQ